MTMSAFGAQTSTPRIQSEISSSQMSTLKGTLHPLANPQFDAGRMPVDTRLQGMSIFFNRSAAQQADLEALLAAQQNPASSLFHQWLTPDQYAARFGMAQADIDKVEAWLQQQGFSIVSVARSRNLIRFSGTAGQVEQAFNTQMHYYAVNGEKHFAPSTALSVPTAMAPAVANIGNLDDFRPKALYIPGNKFHPRADFTSGQSGSVFFAPGDIRTVYDIAPLINSGNDGTGQSIAVVGQSSVAASDIEHFQAAAGVAVKDPTLVLVPTSGVSTPIAGDEGESDLDLEWSSSIAPGASIFFVYTGNNPNYSVFDSIQYAVDAKIGTIITASYGACETAITASGATTALEAIMSQANAQGQTVISASGDQGSTACSGDTTDGLTTAQQEAIAVNYPASSQYVTGLGGTEIIPANSLSTNSTYWDAETPGSDILTSAKIYIPEVAWNDDSSQYGLSSSGGGASALFTKPSYQTALTPADGHRDVPDISLYSSPSYPGYLYCTSDQSDWGSGQTGSCGSGFRASSSDTTLTVAGGTSFAAPIFAGMLSIINQKADFITGQGNINSKLYTLATSSGSYSATAGFHDVTTGNNNCTAGSTYCSSTAGFSAGTGYDQVTGLGSIDLDKLATSWMGGTLTQVATTTTVSASSTAPAVNTSDTFTITVTPESGSTAPTGTVTVIVDGGTPVTGIALTASGTSGVATYLTTFTTTGGHSVVAQYLGDSKTAASTGVITVTVPGSSSGTGTFTLTPSNTATNSPILTVAQGSAGTETLTVKPSGGYTGTVYLTFDTSNDTALANLCYSFATTLSNGDGSVTISNATTSETTTLTFDTNAADCTSAAISKGGNHNLHRLGHAKSASNSVPPNPSRAPLAVAFAGLLLAGFLGRGSRKFRNLAAVIALLAIGLAISACGGGSSGGGGGGGGSVTDPAKGTYTITVFGQDSVTATISAQTTYTFTID
jgi:subtilase family serine protease